MEKNETKIKKTIFRIVLSEKNKSTLDEWINTLEKNFPGINVSFQELVGWAIEKSGPGLSKKDLATLQERFFDHVKQLEWLLEQAKVAKAKGEEFPLANSVPLKTHKTLPSSPAHEIS